MVNIQEIIQQENGKIICEGCKNTFKYKTVCLYKKLRKRITKFACQDCEAETGQCTIWDDTAKAPKDKRYF